MRPAHSREIPPPPSSTGFDHGKGVSCGSSGEKGRKGFALVLSLALMSLVFVLILALIGIVATDLSLSELRKEKAITRANALYSARIALGNLQEQMGPDKRISGPSDLLDEDPLTPKIDGVEHANWVGVWDSYHWDKESQPSYEEARKNFFRKWLVSFDENRDDSTIGLAGDVETPRYGSSRDKMLVSGIGEGKAVHVPVSRVSGEELKDFDIAWWVGDEGTKARADVFPETESSPEPHQLRSAMIATPRVALEALDGLEQYPPADPEAEKVIDLQSLGLALDSRNESSSDMMDPAGQYFHDLTTFSNSVLADARGGGLKKDLNLLFELNRALPGYGADDRSYLYENDSSELASLREKVRTKRSRGNKTEPRWEDVRGYYRQYKEAVVLNSEEGVSFGVKGNYSANTQRLPVVAKLQIVFSYWARDIHGPWKRKYNPPRFPKRHRFLIHCVVEPVITLWNPFGAPLSFKEFRANVMQIPISLRWFKNGNQVGPGWRHYSEIWQLSRNRRKGFDVRIKPPAGEDLITLQPGEVVTYSDGEASLAEFIKVHGRHDDWHGRLSARLDYKPGWHILGGYYTDWLAQGRDVIYGNANDLIGVQVKGQRSRFAGGMGDLYVNLFCTRPNGSGGFIGGHRIQFRANETNWLPRLSPGLDTPERTFGEVHNFKQPFMLLNVVLKTEGDSRYPSLSWVHNSPINQLFHAYDLDEEHMVNMQYEMEMLPMSSFDDIPTVEVAYDNEHGYFGPGLYADKGLSYVTHAELPLEAPISMGALRHANVAKSHNQPLVSYVVGNSYAHPLLPSDGIWVPTTHRGQLHGDRGDRWGPDFLIDHSYHANDRLWDEYFFSSLTPQISMLYSQRRIITEVFRDFQGGRELPNPRMTLWKNRAETDSQTFYKLFSGTGDANAIKSDAYLRSASNLLVKGGFNVNSVSPAAWASLLGANNGADVPVSRPGQAMSVERDVPYPVSRFSMPNAGTSSDSSGFASDQSLWSGFRSLERYKVRELAEKIVEQVKLRGPFLSLGEFINRRVSAGDLGQRGAVQAAADDLDLGLNELFEATSIPIFESDLAAYGYRNPKAAEGLSGEGAPGFITQADLLAPISSLLAVRSDTYRLRAFGGEGINESGSNGRDGAYCEMIVQRLPEYVDPGANRAEDRSPDLSQDNRAFGRRFKIIRFRWLRPDHL